MSALSKHGVRFGEIRDDQVVTALGAKLTSIVATLRSAKRHSNMSSTPPFRPFSEAKDKVNWLSN